MHENVNTYMTIGGINTANEDNFVYTLHWYTYDKKR